MQNDVIAIVDDNSEIVAKYSYDAWGKCTILDDTSGVAIAQNNPFRYRNYYYDTETGLYYIQTRYYDPNTGRFISTDNTIGANKDMASYNLYSYCGNSPVDRYDIGGTFWDSVFNALKSIVDPLLHKANDFLVSLGIDTAAIGASFLDMYKDVFGVYHAKFDCWQQYFGYNDLYDIMFAIGTDMDRKKFPFKSGNKDLIFWLWKGDYINLGAGTEMGIYYGGEPHWLVDKSLKLRISMKLYYKGRMIISYIKKTWWMTGFNPQYLNVRASDLKATYMVDFQDKTYMFKDFKKKWEHTWKCDFDNNLDNIAVYSF